MKHIILAYLISILQVTFCLAQLIDSSNADPKWIWWGYDNSKMPLAVVTGVDLDSKNKVWISLCNRPNGGVGNFSKVDMSDFFHFSQYTRPNTIFGSGPCVLSIAVGQKDTAYFAPNQGNATSVFSVLDTTVQGYYDCFLGSSYHAFRFIKGRIHANTDMGLLILGDTVCTVLRSFIDLPNMSVQDYGYDAEGKLVFLDAFPSGCLFYQTDTGWTCFNLPEKLRWHIFWPSPDFNPRKPNEGYLYLSDLRISPQQGLYRVKGGEITFYTKTQMGTSSNEVVVVKEDSRKTLWVGATKGLASMQNEQWDNHEAMYWLKNAYITDIKFDHRGNVWIASSTGLTVYNPKGVNWGSIKPSIPEIKIYPNPFYNQIKLEVDADFNGSIKYTLTNLYGKVIEHGILHRESQSFLPIVLEFNALSLKEGYYILTTETEKSIKQFKLLNQQP